MKRAYAIGLLGAVVASAVVGVVACGSSDSGGTVTVNDTGSKADTNTPPGDTPPGTDTNVPPPSDGGDTGTTADTSGPDLPPTCATTLKDGKLAEFNDPGSPKKATKGDGIHLTGVIATSGKFLVSKSAKTGTCLYGVFVADANATFVAYSGILVVSQGVDATAGDSGATSCHDGDLIPKDVKAGDTLELKGLYDEFGPTAATCGGATPPTAVPNPAKAPQLAKLCAYTKTGDGTAPAPLAVTPDDIKGTGPDQLKYSGGLVKVTAVKAKTATAPGDTSFGAFALDPSGLAVGDKIYYRGAATAPVVAVGQSFTEITGQSYLDFCTWTLEPRSICDIKPPPVNPDAGADAGPSCP